MCDRASYRQFVSLLESNTHLHVTLKQWISFFSCFRFFFPSVLTEESYACHRRGLGWRQPSVTHQPFHCSKQKKRTQTITHKKFTLEKLTNAHKRRERHQQVRSRQNSTSRVCVYIYIYIYTRKGGQKGIFFILRKHRSISYIYTYIY